MSLTNSITMKFLLSFICVLSSIVINAQDVSGTYQLTVNATNGDLQRILTLNADGTFEFYNFERHEQRIPPEKHIYGKGTWTQDKKLITFFSETSDLNDKFTLDFNGTKARFISKSPRDTTNRNIATTLSFYESDIFWISGMKLVKQ